VDQYEVYDLTDHQDIPTRRASRPKRTQVQVPFVDTDQLPTTSSTRPTARSRTFMRLRLVVGIMMVTFSAMFVLVVVLMWPVLVRSTESTMNCAPPFITTDCPHIQYQPYGRK
jgi:hypothetical protein